MLCRPSFFSNQKSAPSVHLVNYFWSCKFLIVWTFSVYCTASVKLLIILRDYQNTFLLFLVWHYLKIGYVSSLNLSDKGWSWNQSIDFAWNNRWMICSPKKQLIPFFFLVAFLPSVLPVYRKGPLFWDCWTISHPFQTCLAALRLFCWVLHFNKAGTIFRCSF